jgi:predicted  nucleic acid-binding Zn-ribbon protein
MGTQLLLSLIGGGVAGAGLAFLVVKYAYKWYKKEKIIISGEVVAIASILIITGAVSAYKLGEASYHIAKDGVEYVQEGASSAIDSGQQLIENTLKWGTVTLLEGIGQPYHDYQKKWEADKIKPIEEMDIKIISSRVKEVNNEQLVHLVVEVKNSGTTPLNLNNLLSEELIVLTDKNSNAYALNKLQYENSTIKAGETSLREMDIILPKGVELHQLSTPIKQLLLNP